MTIDPHAGTKPKTPEDRAEMVADLLNAIFEMELGWAGNRPPVKATADHVSELMSLIWRLMQLVDFETISRCIAVLNPPIVEAGLLLQGNKWAHHSEMTLDQRMRLQDKMLNAKDMTEYVVGSITEHRGPFVADKNVELMIDEIMKRFVQAEELQLRHAGLNQLSVATIMDAIRARLPKISEHVMRRTRIPHSRVMLPLNYLEDLPNKYGRGLAAAGMTAPVRRLTPSVLRRAKTKIIAVATLWGDAVPLLLCKDWGITSVISATAGATLAAIIPSGERDNSD